MTKTTAELVSELHSNNLKIEKQFKELQDTYAKLRTISFAAGMLVGAGLTMLVSAVVRAVMT